MATALIYCRISKHDRGEAFGVARQEKLCRRLASRHDLDVGRVLVDNDVSAFRVRPAFEQVVEASKKGEADALLVYHADRLYRRMGRPGTSRGGRGGDRRPGAHHCRRGCGLVDGVGADGGPHVGRGRAA
jgi:hypothetical protein